MSNLPLSDHEPEPNYFEAPQSTTWQQPSLPPQLELPQRRWTHWHTASWLVYACSFVLPIQFNGQNGSDMLFGGAVLFVMGCFWCWHPMGWSWFANLLLFATLFYTMKRRSKAAMITSAIASLLAVSFSIIWPMIGDDEGDRLPWNWPCYQVWVLAMLLQTVANYRLWREVEANTNNEK